MRRLRGVGTALVAPGSGAGSDHLFWLELRPGAGRVSVRERAPWGRTRTLARGLGILPHATADPGNRLPGTIERTTYPTRALAVDASHAYFFRRRGGRDQVVRVPIGGGRVQVIARRAGVTRLSAIAVDRTHVYWAERAGGRILRARKPPRGDPARRHRLTVATRGGGRVIAAPRAAGGRYREGTLVRLRARAAPGWRFDRWTSGCFAPRNACAITMGGPRRAVARFVRRR